MKINKCKYPKLDGKITEVFGTRSAFAEAIGISVRSIANKMHGVTPWKSTEINKACEVLSIPATESGLYFSP